MFVSLRVSIGLTREQETFEIVATIQQFLKKADRVTHKAVNSISLENHPVQPLAGNNKSVIFLYQLYCITVIVNLAGQPSRGPICRTNIFQRTNLPGPNLSGPSLPQKLLGPNLPRTEVVMVTPKGKVANQIGLEGGGGIPPPIIRIIP